MGIEVNYTGCRKILCQAPEFAFYALLDRNDNNHKVASKIWHKIIEDEAELYTSNYTSEAPPQTDEPVVSYDIPVIVIVIVIVDVHVYVHDHG